MCDHLCSPRHRNGRSLAFVGRLTEEKQLGLLVQALVQLGEPVNLLFVGEGPEIESLQAMCHELGLSERTKFMGACHDEEKLAEYFSTADLCVSPGNVGLLAMHSLVYGTPLITHDDPTHQGPEFEAVIEGRTGGFFQRGNVESLAEKIQEWLERNEAEREPVKQDCMAVIDRFYTPKRQCAVFKAVLDGQVPEAVPITLE